VTAHATATMAEESRGDTTLASSSRWPMFVLVDTSLMNVSISAGRRPLHDSQLLNGWRMTRLPDPEPSAGAESLLAG
jgi:hypothetical protein